MADTPIAWVDDLYLTYIKSTKMTWQNHLHLSSVYGVNGDREYVIIDANTHRFISQRELPQLALVSVHKSGNCLDISYSSDGKTPEGLGSLQRAQEDGRKRIQIQIWKDTIFAFEQDSLLDGSLSEELKRNVKLVKLDSGDIRLARSSKKSHSRGEIKAQDGEQIHLISRTSIKDLNDRMEGNVSDLHFRPNIVLRGLETPYSEDRMYRIGIGNDVELEAVGPTSRCKTIGVDPHSGEATSNDALATLAKYRRHPIEKNKVLFGMHFRIAVGGIVRVKDPVYLIL